MMKAMVRNNICLNAHPEGLASEVEKEISQVKQALQPAEDTPKTVLVLGCSTGFGLSSRIAAAFGYKAYTVGVSYERQASEKKPGSPGYYNNRAFDKAAKDAGMHSWTLETDAFSHEAKKAVIQHIQEQGKTFDLVVYSLASGVRQDPDSGKMYKSVLKPLGKPYTVRTIDYMTEQLSDVSFEPGDQADIDATVKVMGGEDWAFWIHALKNAGVLSPGVLTLAYSYIGPKLSHDIYREGTIGMAKLHLEKTAKALDAELKDMNGRALISVNKALVTRASAVIPGMALYIAVLFAVMKEQGVHEGCCEQIIRLFSQRIYDKGLILDEQDFLRVDDWEMEEKVQKEVEKRMHMLTQENLSELADLESIKKAFLNVHGFAVDGVDYSEKTAFIVGEN